MIDPKRLRMASLTLALLALACGEAGDILLWHRLLAHTAGWNRSKRLQLREAVLCDYAPREAEEAKTSYQDMWEDWSDEVRAASG